MRKTVLAVALIVLSGCSSSIGQQLVKPALDFTGNDLRRTSQLAEKYGKPEVKQCADFLVASIGKLNADENSLQALLAEETDGLFSAALKAVLVRDYVAGLNDPTRAEAFKKEFDAQCHAVAGTLVLNIARDAAKIARRVN